MIRVLKIGDNGQIGMFFRQRKGRADKWGRGQLKQDSGNNS